MVRVRFAPSPTGIMHIGGARTALFNFLFAKHNGGEFILRIEDTDQERLVKEAEKSILQTLEWLDLIWDEKYKQSERLSIYKEHSDILKDRGMAYEDKGAIRFKMPKKGETSWNDHVGNKKITFNNEDQEDFVILKSDGYPTYNFANVIDDYLMKISHVIRGEEFISSTPKHVQLYKAFSWNEPFFAHLPVILGTDKTKLSKRHGAKSALDFKHEGYLKETLLNFIALLGWNPGGNREQLSVSEMIDLFKLEDINSANPIFDIHKLDWLNGVWIRSLEKEELGKRLLDFYKDDKEVSRILEGEAKNDLIVAVQSRLKILSDFKNLVSLKKERQYTQEEKKKSRLLLKYLETKLKNSWKEERLLFVLKDFSEEQKISFKQIYFLMTGREQGIGILELNKIYGKEFFVKNLSDG